MKDGVCWRRGEGTPQGGPLSPLLANVVLDELDKELERRGHRFCRYADDCNIYVKSRKAAERVMEGVRRFIERKLRLKVNEAKSRVAPSGECKFLGYTIGGGGRLRVAAKSKERMRAKLKALTKRNRGRALGEVIGEGRAGWNTSGGRRRRHGWPQPKAGSGGGGGTTGSSRASGESARRGSR